MYFALLFLLAGPSAHADVPSQRPYGRLFQTSAWDTREVMRRAPLEEGRVYTALRVNEREGVIDEVSSVWRQSDQTVTQPLTSRTVAELGVFGDAVFGIEAGFMAGGDLKVSKTGSGWGRYVGLAYVDTGASIDVVPFDDQSVARVEMRGVEGRFGISDATSDHTAYYVLVRHLTHNDFLQYESEGSDHKITSGSGKTWATGLGLNWVAPEAFPWFGIPKPFTFSAEFGIANSPDARIRSNNHLFFNFRAGIRFDRRLSR